MSAAVKFVPLYARMAEMSARGKTVVEIAKAFKTQDHKVISNLGYARKQGVLKKRRKKAKAARPVGTAPSAPNPRLGAAIVFLRHAADKTCSCGKKIPVPTRAELLALLALRELEGK